MSKFKIQVSSSTQLAHVLKQALPSLFCRSVLSFPQVLSQALPSLTVRKHVNRFPQMVSQALPALPAIALLLATMVLAKNGKRRLLWKQISAVWTTSSM
jgi:hypothetical protein